MYNNPLIPGDPYMYDIRWIVSKILQHGAELSNLDEKIRAAVIAALDQHDPIYFESADALINSGIKAGALAYIEGYYAPGDGGANLYITTDDYNDIIGADFYITLSGPNKWALPVILTPYITPEMFGAKGDGVIDDTNAIKNCFNFNNIQYILKGDYLISDIIPVEPHNIVINGGGRIFRSTQGSMFSFGAGSYNVVIDDIRFEAPVSDTDTALIVFQKSSATAGIYESCNDITIKNCSFTGATIELGLYSTTNAIVENCIFNNCRARNYNVVGGYCVLLQSAFNTVIRNCFFKNQQEVRHGIYISVDPSKTANIACINTLVENNIIDDSEQLFVNTNQSAIIARNSYDTKIIGNYFKKAVGIAFNAEDGPIYGDVSNNVFDDCSLNSIPSETKSCININAPAGSYEVSLNITNNKEINHSAGNLFMQLGALSTGRIICNTTDGLYIEVEGNVYLNENYSPYTYVYRINAATFTGHFGPLAKSSTLRPLLIASGVTISARQLPPEWLTYRFAEAYNTIANAYNDAYTDISVVKNDVNDYTLTFPGLNDVYFTAIAPVSSAEYNIRCQHINNGIRVYAVKPDGTPYTTPLNDQRLIIGA